MHDLFRLVLELEEYSVITANDGLYALNVLKQQKPDLILLDMNMPRVDQVGLLNIGKPSLKLGAQMFLDKPLSPDLLIEAVKAGLNGKQVEKKKLSSYQALIQRWSIWFSLRLDLQIISHTL